MQKNFIEEYFKLFYHNQDNIYFGTYDTTFEPFETPEGKLKYKSKIGRNPQTRPINKEFSFENVVTHLLYNSSNPYCDENGIGNNEKFTSYGKPVVNKIKVGKHEVIDGSSDLGIVAPPLGTDGKGVFGAIDVDIYNDPRLLERVVKQIYSEKLPLVPCFSKSGGLHLYVFSKEPFEYYEIDNALTYFNQKLEIKAKEIFPKQRKQPGKPGNGIALPYRSTILQYKNNFENEVKYRADFNPNKNVLVKEDLSLGTLNEFLIQCIKVKNTWTKEYWSKVPITEKKKKEKKEAVSSLTMDAASNKIIRPPSTAADKIMEDILEGKEHKSGGTFDNHIVSLVTCCVKYDKRTDDEIKSYFDRVKHKSEKGSEPNYIETKIDNCRKKYKILNPDNLIAEFLSNIVWDMEEDKFFDMRTNRPLSPTSLNMKFSNLFSRKTNATDIFREYENHLLVEAKMYRPDLYDASNRVIKDRTCKYLNTFIPGTLQPIKPTMGDLKPYFELMQHLFPIEKERNHVENFLAFIVQNPGVKIRHAILVYTKHFQTGKGSLFEIMIDILGEDNAEPGSVKSILDKGVTFTNKLLVLIDECRNAGDFNENKKLLNDLKIIITEQRIQKRVLYKDFGATKQFTNFIIFTNNDDALSIDDKDARYFVTENLEPRKDQKFYTDFHAWRKDKGSAYVMSYLLDKDLSNFDHTKPAPDTDAKSKMARTSSHVLQIDMENRFNEGKQPFNFNDQIKGTSELQEWYKQFGTSTLQKAATNPKTISQCLEGLGFYKVGQVLQKSTGQKPSLWIVRDIDRLKKKQPTELCNEIWKPLNLSQSDEELRTQQQIRYANRSENVQRLFSGREQPHE
jgi:hypothetical protein